jgi:hypothetical protein
MDHDAAYDFFVEIYGNRYDSYALWPSEPGIHPVTGKPVDVETGETEQADDVKYASKEEYWADVKCMCEDTKFTGALELWQNGNIGEYMSKKGHFACEEWSYEKGGISNADMAFLDKVILCMETLLGRTKKRRV